MYFQGHIKMEVNRYKQREEIILTLFLYVFQLWVCEAQNVIDCNDFFNKQESYWFHLTTTSFNQVYFVIRFTFRLSFRFTFRFSFSHNNLRFRYQDLYLCLIRPDPALFHNLKTQGGGHIVSAVGFSRF